MLLNDAVQITMAITKEILPKDIPVALAFRLEKIVNVFREDVNLFFNMRKTLVEKYGDPIEGKEDEYTFSSENQQKINGEIDALLNSPVQFDESLKIPAVLFQNVTMRGTVALRLKSIMKDVE